MTWMKFALWLSGIYLMYYGALLSWDLLRGGKKAGAARSAELSFEEAIEPVKMAADNWPQPYESSVISSGGVSLKQLFSLAREEVIAYTRPVSY